MQVPTTAERQRKLPSLTWASGQLVSALLPRDTILKRLQIRMSGTVVYTFASAVTASELSSMDNIINRIDVVVDGSRAVKSVRPHMLHMEQLLATQIQGERKASAAAAAAKDNNPLTDGGMVFGTTTQTTTIAESVTLSFEMILSKSGRLDTLLNLKGVSSAEIKFSCGTLSGLDKSGNATFTSGGFTLDLTTVEAQDLPGGLQFSWWKQTTQDVAVTAQTNEKLIDINRGNLIAGIKILATQDANGAAAAALRRQPTNFIIDKIALMKNGMEIIKSTTFFELQAENRQRFGVSAPNASSQSRIDGFVYLDLLADGLLSTALDARKLDQLQLLISTKGTDTTYVNYPCNLTVETGEIVLPAAA